MDQKGVSREYASPIDWAQLYVLAWLDEEFKNLLELNPRLAADRAKDYADKYVSVDQNPFTKGSFNFQRIIQVDPIPSVLDGYSENLVLSMSEAEGTALALPSGYTTC